MASIDCRKANAAGTPLGGRIVAADVLESERTRLGGVEVLGRHSAADRFICVMAGAILFLIFCGMYFHMPLARPGCVEPSYAKGYEQSEEEDCAAFALLLWRLGHLIDRLHDDIAAISTVVIAAYTIVLGRATIGLRQVSERQHGEMQRSTEVANIAAKAAQSSADALPILERAYIFINVNSEPAFVRGFVWLGAEHNERT